MKSNGFTLPSGWLSHSKRAHTHPQIAASSTLVNTQLPILTLKLSFCINKSLTIKKQSHFHSLSHPQELGVTLHHILAWLMWKKRRKKHPTAFSQSCGTQLVSDTGGDWIKLRGLCLQRPLTGIKDPEMGGSYLRRRVKLPGDKPSLEKHETTGPKAEH